MRFLDGILAALVALSLTLSAALWWQQPEFRVIQHQPAPADSRPQPIQPIQPNAVTRPALLLHFPDDRHVALSPGQPGYNYVWQGVESALRSLRFDRLSDHIAPASEELALRRQDWAIEFTLSGTLTLGDWLASWGLDGPPGVGEGPGVTRILISLQEPAAAIVWTASGPTVLRAVTSAHLRDVLQTMSLTRHSADWRLLPELIEGVRLADDIYVPDITALPTYTVRPDVPTRSTSHVAGAFFLDLSVVRTITEHDNAVLFTDGQAGLRIYPWGGIEYQRAQAEAHLQESPPALLPSLERAYQYAQARDMWPREAYLASSSRATGHRTLRFAQRLGGWPVFAATPALEISFDGNGVVRYGRSAFPVRTVGQTAAIVPPERAVAAIADIIGWRRVTGVELGYYRPAPPQAEIQPGSMPPGTTPPDTPDRVQPDAGPNPDDPTDHHPPPDPDADRRYQPVWRLTVTGGLQHFVDATTGRLLGGDAP